MRAGFFLLVVSTLLAGTWQSLGNPVLGYNATESIPRGLYLVTKHPAEVRTGSLVCVADDALPDWVRRRDYRPAGWPLCKQVAAKGGGKVQRSRDRLQVCDSSGRCLDSLLRSSDSKGRPMPSAFADGQTAIPPGWVYLHSAHARGLDSRYIGLVPESSVTLSLVPLLTAGGTS